MAVSTRCKGCGLKLEAANEDKLIDAVQRHLAEKHARGHEPSREQIRTVIRARGDHEH